MHLTGQSSWLVPPCSTWAVTLFPLGTYTNTSSGQDTQVSPEHKFSSRVSGQRLCIPSKFQTLQVLFLGSQLEHHSLGHAEPRESPHLQAPEGSCCQGRAGPLLESHQSSQQKCIYAKRFIARCRLNPSWGRAKHAPNPEAGRRGGPMRSSWPHRHQPQPVVPGSGRGWEGEEGRAAVAPLQFGVCGLREGLSPPKGLPINEGIPTRKRPP